MKIRKKVLFVALVVLLSGSAVFAQVEYETYENWRFEFSIDYPANLTPQPEPANSDGRAFKNMDAEMRAYGSFYILRGTLRREYAALLRERRGAVTYKTVGANFFVISGRRNGKIFYRKTVRDKDGVFITFEIEYKESKRAFYDRATERIVRSLKINNS